MLRHVDQVCELSMRYTVSVDAPQPGRIVQLYKYITTTVIFLVTLPADMKFYVLSGQFTLSTLA